MKTNLITFLAISLLLGSCGTTSTLTLQKDGSGNCSVSIHVEKPLIDYFIDMAEVSGLYTSGEQAILFDTQRIKTILAKNPGLSITELRSAQNGELFLSFSFKNINTIIQSDPLLKKADILTYRPGPENTIVIKIDGSSLNNVFSSLLPENLVDFRYLLPQPGETREEYYSTLDFVFDDGASLFKISYLTLAITVNGKILRHNGVLQQPATARFTMALDTLFFLEKPMEYFIVFQ